MAFFKVQPGASFHSIQEVFTSERPRMSIQGARRPGLARPGLACLPAAWPAEEGEQAPARHQHATAGLHRPPAPSVAVPPPPGWFHSEQAPDGAELATRSQLQLRAGQDTAADFQPFTGGLGCRPAGSTAQHAAGIPPLQRCRRCIITPPALLRPRCSPSVQAAPPAAAWAPRSCRSWAGL